MMATVKFCGICGSPQLGPHCDNDACTWCRCRKCSTVMTVDGLHIIDGRSFKKES